MNLEDAIKALMDGAKRLECEIKYADWKWEATIYKVGDMIRIDLKP